MITSLPRRPALQPRSSWLLVASRLLMAAFFGGAGVMHFVHADKFTRVVPPVLPARRAIVYISGVCEIAGGVGVLIPLLRRWAGWGLIAMLIAIFPANIYMALYPRRFDDFDWGRPRLLWARLPVQFLLIAWVWASTLRQRGTGVRSIPS